MAGSRFAYVRTFETDTILLPQTWIVVRLDGRGFTRFSEAHGFHKPNDDRGLRLMTHAATQTMREFGEIVAAYGQSDEYSFVFARTCALYGRRTSKIVTAVCSVFTAAYALAWPIAFPDTPLTRLATFDGRAVCYPAEQCVRDYLSWRQADCHINNLYNTCFWALVHGGLSTQQAHDRLRGTVAASKNELLFSQFNINYNNIPSLYRKGTILVRTAMSPLASQQVAELLEQQLLLQPTNIVALHEDVIGDTFWLHYNDVLT